MNNLQKTVTSSALPFVFRQRCETIALDERHRLGLRSFDPLPAEKLVTAYGARLLTPAELPNAQPHLIERLQDSQTWSAAIVCRYPLTILYQPNCSPARHQSNLMHEFGHILLKHPMGSLLAETGLVNKNVIHEREAGYLGGCLQLPKRALEWAVQQGMDKDDVGKYYTASEQMVQYRSQILRIKFPMITL